MSLAPFAALEARIAAVTSARLSNAYVVLSNGQAFGAELDRADFDPIAPPSIVGDVQITYPAATAALEPGETIMVNGVSYRVASDPMRDGLMMTCQLRESA